MLNQWKGGSITDIPAVFQIRALSDIPSPWGELIYGHIEKFHNSFNAEAPFINPPWVFFHTQHLDIPRGFSFYCALHHPQATL